MPAWGVDMRLARVGRSVAGSLVRATARSVPAVDQALRRRRYNAAWWNNLYSTAHDPFGFDTSGYERGKFADTLEALQTRHYSSALEVGCSVGTFTEMLAPRCDRLLALDIAEAAVQRTNARCASFPHVRAKRAAIPADLPDGPFDLIICSDVLYYLTPRALVDAVGFMGATIPGGGTFLALHYLGDFGTPSSGDLVHDMLPRLLSDFRHSVNVHRRDVGPHGAGYRLDRFDRPSR